jgi:hypothetical protein
MHHFRRRLGYANVLASLSLFLALGGGAYAAGTQSPAKTSPRITSVSVGTDAPAGTVVARAGGVRLQMAGVGYALEVSNDSAESAYYSCQGVSGDDGSPIVEQGYASAGQTTAIIGNAQAPATLTCRLADRDTGTTTEALLGRGKSAYYAGHVISDGAQ